MAETTDGLDSPSSTLSRGDLLRRGGAAAFAVSMFGGLSDKAFGFYGPLKFAHKQLAGDLRIMTWAHFVPSYDQWLDNTYVKQWGEANDVEVKVDHINNALLYSTGAAEVAAQSGHDLFWFISPPGRSRSRRSPSPTSSRRSARSSGRWHALRGRRRTTRRRSSSTASPRRTRPTRCSTARASSSRPVSASTHGRTCEREPPS